MLAEGKFYDRARFGIVPVRGTAGEDPDHFFGRYIGILGGMAGGFIPGADFAGLGAGFVGRVDASACRGAENFRYWPLVLRGVTLVIAIQSPP
jgi:hypothetical protein